MPRSGDEDDPPSKRGGRGVAVEDTYKRHAPLLREIAEKKFNIPPSDAESLVNEVFTAYLLRRNIVRDTKKWLIGAICHASRAWWRAAAKTTSLPSDLADYVDPDSGALETRIVDRVTMAAALRRIGPKCREILRLYYGEGYSAAEIAARLGTTTGYVIQLLHTCRKRVRKAYEQLKDNDKDKST